MMRRLSGYLPTAFAARLVARKGNRHGQSEEGFTLFELLVVILIMPVVVGALTFAVVSIFSLTGSTSTRLSNGSNVETLSPTFEADVANAQSITTCPNVDGASTCTAGSQATTQCGSPADTLVITFDFSPPPTANTAPTGEFVSYVGVPVGEETTSAITAVSDDGTQFTFTVPNQFISGEQVTVAGMTPATYNGVWKIATATSTYFTVSNTSTPGPVTVLGTVEQTLYNLVRNTCDAGASTSPSSSMVLASNLSGASIFYLEESGANGSLTESLPTPATGPEWVYTGQSNCSSGSEGISGIELTITESDEETSSTLAAAPLAMEQLQQNCENNGQ